MTKPTTNKVAIVIISHSPDVASGTAKMVRQMSGQSVPVVSVGGDFEGGLGTDVEAIHRAYEEVFCDQGVLVIYDLGSAEMSAETARELLDPEKQEKVIISHAPLVEGEEDKLKYLFKSRPLPIFIDESCRFSEDVARHYEYVDGVNLKLMKCGGITEALRILNVAKSHNLKTMIGCMSESSISISAGASISGIIDYVDLDSHYNLDPDPSEGAKMIDGITMNDNKPGHGSKLKTENYA